MVNDLLNYEFLNEELIRVLSPLVGTVDSSELPHLKKNASHLEPFKIFTPYVLNQIQEKFGS